MTDVAGGAAAQRWKLQFRGKPTLLWALVAILTVGLILLWCWFFQHSQDAAHSFATQPWQLNGVVLVLIAVGIIAVFFAGQRDVHLLLALLLLADTFAFIVFVFAARYMGISQLHPSEFFPEGTVKPSPLGPVEAAYFALGTLTGGTGPINAQGGDALQTRMGQIIIDYAFTTFAVAVIVARFSEWIRTSPAQDPAAKSGGRPARRHPIRLHQGNSAQPVAEAGGNETSTAPDATEHEEPKQESPATGGSGAQSEAEPVLSTRRARRSEERSASHRSVEPVQPEEPARDGAAAPPTHH